MEARIAELRYKEVISVEDGSRYGYVGDIEIDLETGHVRALVVPGRRRFFGLLGREEDRRIPWNCVRRFGEDIILVQDRPPLQVSVTGTDLPEQQDLPR
ncbi:YlmC/YmxH family sporulation protein [bacterium 1xD42-67]|nr:YlmC/YmxH family sporulation protein [bacterium 1xD42-67]